MTAPEEPTWDDYSAAVRRYTEAIGRMLAAGDEAKRRTENFYLRHDIETGSGERALTAPNLPLAQREANRWLLNLRAAAARAGRPPGFTLAGPASSPSPVDNPVQPHRDAFTQWLARHRPDLPLRPFKPRGIDLGIDVGWEVDFAGTTLAYAVLPFQPEVLRLLNLEARATRRNLRSPLADLVRFLRLIHESGTGLQRLTWTMFQASGSGLPFDRLLAFVRRYTPARFVDLRHGAPHFEADVAPFSWTSERAKVRLPRPKKIPIAPRPTPLPPSTPSIAARALGSRTRI